MGDTATDTVTAHASDEALNDTSAPGRDSGTVEGVQPTNNVTNTADPTHDNEPGDAGN